MNKTLDVHTAELTTAALEVKTLTIRGKQVTLAVFRQLQEEPLLLEDGSLAGIPWGRVNYHPDKCADTGAHMHLVWQQEAELRRARVETNPAFGTFWAEGDLNDFITIGIVRSWLRDTDKFWSWIADQVNSQRDRSYGNATFTFAEFPRISVGAGSDLENGELPRLPDLSRHQRRAEELERLLSLDPAEDEAQREDDQVAYDQYLAGRHVYKSPPEKPLGERIDAARRACADAIDDAHEAALAVHNWLFNSRRPSLETARRELLAEVADEQARRDRIRSTTAMLSDLSQLFIAV